MLVFNFSYKQKFLEFTNKFYWIAIIAVYFFLEFLFIISKSHKFILFYKTN